VQSGTAKRKRKIDHGSNSISFHFHSALTRIEESENRVTKERKVLE